MVAGTKGFHKPLCRDDRHSLSVGAWAKKPVRSCSCGERRAPKHAALVAMLRDPARKGTDSFFF